MTTRSGKVHCNGIINKQTNRTIQKVLKVVFHYCHLIPFGHLQGSKIQYGIFFKGWGGGVILVQGIFFGLQFMSLFAPHHHLKSRVSPRGGGGVVLCSLQRKCDPHKLNKEKTSDLGGIQAHVPQILITDAVPTDL